MTRALAALVVVVVVASVGVSAAHDLPSRAQPTVMLAVSAPVEVAPEPTTTTTGPATTTTTTTTTTVATTAPTTTTTTQAPPTTTTTTVAPAPVGPWDPPLPSPAPAWTDPQLPGYHVCWNTYGDPLPQASPVCPAGWGGRAPEHPLARGAR